MNARGKKILVVDDQAVWRDQLTKTLRGNGFRAEAVDTIEKAEELLKRMNFHMVLLDIRMDDSDPQNIEGMELLRGEVLRDDIRIMILSAYGTKEYMRESFGNRYVSNFISKMDFDEDNFINRVRDALSPNS